jgi:hypothetical protein
MRPTMAERTAHCAEHMTGESAACSNHVARKIEEKETGVTDHEDW